MGEIGWIKRESKCPNCGSTNLIWTKVRGDFGAAADNGHCLSCNAVLRGRECAEVSLGKHLEKDGYVEGVAYKDIYCLDKRITRLSGDTQLGLLRQRKCTN